MKSYLSSYYSPTKTGENHKIKSYLPSYFLHFPHPPQINTYFCIAQQLLLLEVQIDITNATEM